LPLDGTQAGVELLELHHRIRRMLGDTRPPARHLPTPCRCCGHRLLFETHDADGQWDGAHCRNCRAEYTLADYWVLVQETAQAVAAQQPHLATRQVTRYPPVTHAGDTTLNPCVSWPPHSTRAQTSRHPTHPRSSSTGSPRRTAPTSRNAPSPPSTAPPATCCGPPSRTPAHTWCS